ncbi:DUF421 domain-containing protein [Acinetobacter sp. B5B]|uniref:DUF421 domain-containing protein n=1 Tax=Acinetobacter baretiae TaxID=2605383 RepID=UPI001B3C8742|nr:YetF domain-containing protein [Acinetobacter baretiae]MBF7682896.1 DUF421 domain-containing protein [Acinetobacter baretiae]MBF7684862.1 DUF421 domain-containing protein [Acinetobacter baretiae]
MINDLYLLVLVKLVISFSILISYMSFIGKTQITQFNAIDFIGNFVFGAVVGGSIYNMSLPLVQFTLLLLLSVSFMWFLNYLSRRFIPFRRIAVGEPIVIIKNGRFLLSEIERKKRKIDIFRVLSQLHCMGFHSFKDVYYAEIQTDGLIAAIKDTATPPSEIFIHSGSILESVIKDYDLTKEQLEEKLIKAEIEIEKIFVAEHYGDRLYITCNDQSTKSIKLEILDNDQ